MRLEGIELVCPAPEIVGATDGETVSLVVEVHERALALARGDLARGLASIELPPRGEPGEDCHFAVGPLPEVSLELPVPLPGDRERLRLVEREALRVSGGFVHALAIRLSDAITAASSARYEQKVREAEERHRQMVEAAGRVEQPRRPGPEPEPPPFRLLREVKVPTVGEIVREHLLDAVSTGTFVTSLAFVGSIPLKVVGVLADYAKVARSYWRFLTVVAEATGVSRARAATLTERSYVELATSALEGKSPREQERVRRQVSEAWREFLREWAAAFAGLLTGGAVEWERLPRGIREALEPLETGIGAYSATTSTLEAAVPPLERGKDERQWSAPAESGRPGVARASGSAGLATARVFVEIAGATYRVTRTQSLRLEPSERDRSAGPGQPAVPTGSPGEQTAQPRQAAPQEPVPGPQPEAQPIGRASRGPLGAAGQSAASLAQTVSAAATLRPAAGMRLAVVGPGLSASAELPSQDLEGDVLRRAALPGSEARAPVSDLSSARQIALFARDRGGGAALSKEVRARLEPLVDRPLGDVRVHRGPAAGAAARALSAQAFTVGRDVFMGDRQPGPDTAAGLGLLAHEATHVAQQVPIGLASPAAAPSAQEKSAQAVGQHATTASRRPAGLLAVDEIEFGVANQVSADLGVRAPGIFALARVEARRAVDALVAGDPRLQAALAASRADEPGVVAPVRLEVDGKADGVLARELGEAVARRVVERARQLAGQAPAAGAGAATIQRSPAEAPAGAPGSLAGPLPAAAPGATAQAPELVAPAAPPRPTISPEMETWMRADVETITGYLKSQWMSAEDERDVLRLIEKWAGADDIYNSSTGYRGSDYLDRFLFFLKMRTFPRRTARTAWIEQWTNAYDCLWYEMEGERLTRFRELVGRSRRQGSSGPERERMESVWSYVGKREAMGVWGTLKGMGLVLAGVADTVIWLQWKTQGVPLRQALRAAGVRVEDQPPSIAKYLDKQYDEVARELAGAMASTSKEQEELLNEKLLADRSAYGIGTFGGKVVGTLTTAGALAEAGAVGQAIGAAQTAQAAGGLYDTVARLRQGPPPLTWSQIAKRPDVWAQVVGVVGGAIGTAGGFAKAGSSAAKTFADLGILANTTQTALLVAAYQAADDDPTLSPEMKSQMKEELLLQIVTTGALTIDQRYGPAFKAAWARKLQQGTGQPAPGAEAKAAPGAPEAEVTKQAATVAAVEAAQRGGRPPSALAESSAGGVRPVEPGEPTGPRPPEGERALAAAGEQPGQPARMTVEQLRPALEAGGEQAAAAAKALITQFKDWKGQIRRLAGSHGELAPAAVGALEQARSALIEQALSQVREKYPDIKPTNVGTPGLGSDVDITFNPSVPPNPSDPAAMAAAIKRSGDAAREFTAALRKASGGEPDAVLDTNAYTYTGIEAQLPQGRAPASRGQEAAAARQMDVASLAEIHRSMERAYGPDAPAEWARFRREAIQRATPGGAEVGPEQARLQKQLADELKRQFKDAEEMSTRVSAAESSMQSVLARRTQGAGEAAPDRAALLAQAREQVAAARRNELIQALQKEPIDVVRVRRLQAELKLLEPGAYASGAAIADVVQYQQALKGAPTYAKPGQEVIDVRTGERVTIGRQVTDPRELAQGAASNLAQLAEHMRGRTGDLAELHDQLKAIAKYCSRIDHARMAAGLKGGVPEIESRYRTADTDEAARVAMVETWAKNAGLGGSSFAEQANAFIAAHYAWARDQAIGLRLISMTRPELATGSRGGAPPAKPAAGAPAPAKPPAAKPPETPAAPKPAQAQPPEAAPVPTTVGLGKRQRAELVRYWQDMIASAPDQRIRSRYQGYIDRIKAGKRPTWRQSEMEMAYFHGQIGAQTEVPYKYGARTSRTRQGSTRPDIRQPSALVEVKNYRIENADKLVAELKRQVEARREHGPADVKSQSVILDMRGQKASRAELIQLAQRIARETGLPVGNVQIVTW